MAVCALCADHGATVSERGFHYIQDDLSETWLEDWAGAGISDVAAAHGWWLALLVGLALTVPTALTGLLDWLTITWWTPLWRTATWHLIAMVSATVFFLLAAILGKDAFDAGNLGAGDVGLTLIGFGLLTAGGGLGGTITFGPG